MATTKKTVAKKTVAKKSTAKKTVARKTPAKKTVAAKPIARKTTAEKATAATKTAAKATDDTFKQYTAVAGDQIVELRKLVRDVVDIYVGIPFLLGTRFSDAATTPNVDVDALKALVEDVKVRLAEVPSVDFDAVKAFVDEAKTVGHAQLTAFEDQLGTVGKRFDVATTKLTAQLPTQVVDALESGRARLRSLYAA